MTDDAGPRMPLVGAGTTRYPRVYTKPNGNLRCNICEQVVASLSEDHVPPQSCLVDRHVELEPFERSLRKDSPRLPISQNGLRFKTICGACNSYLGHTCDPALAALSANVRANTGVAVTHGGLGWSVWCRPALIIRSLFGHLLAASTDDAQTVPDRQMRQALLEPAKPLTASLRVFYWLFPHRQLKVVRGIAMPSVRGAIRSQPAVFDILKFFPLAFAVTELDAYHGLPRLDAFVRRDPEAEVEIPFSSRLLAPFDWPEKVDEGNFIMGGRSLTDAVTARPRPPKKKGP